MSESTHIRTCPLCESMCGLRMEVREGRVEKIRPNPDDVWSRGYSCPKGISLGALHEDPDRLRTPRIRRGSTFEEASWEEAFAEIERGLHSLIAAHGVEAITAYIGNPTAHNFSLSRYVGAFIAMSGIPRIYSAGTVDQWPKNVSAALMYGGMWTIPTPDIDRTDHLIVMGANPHASQGSLLASADVLGKFRALRKRGGRLVVIDPRRTGTAKAADEWIPIQPGTDAALLLAFAQVLFEEDRVDLGALADSTRGLERVRDLCRDFTPEFVAEVCRIPAETIRRLALDFATAERAALYGRIGTCNQEFGTLASWLVDVVNILAGKFDRPGGLMFSNPIAPSMTTLRPPEFAQGWSFGRWKSRVRGAAEVLGQVPLSCLAEEIATPGEGQIRGLITVAGNPVLSAPDAAKLDAALPGLDFMLAVDNYLNETSRHAHVILPGLSPLEQPHYDELIWSWAVRNAGKYSPALFEPEPGRPHEWQILLTLSAILQGQKASEVDTGPLDDLFFAGLVASLAALPQSGIHGRDPGEIVSQSAGRGPERILDFAIRSGPWGEGYGANPEGLTLEVMARHPHGLDKGALEPRLPGILETPDGKIDLAPAYICGDLERLRVRMTRDREDGVLISRRHLRSNNSWMHNLPTLMSGRDRCTLLIHPEDIQRWGLEDGKLARVISESGSLEVPVEASEDMLPGVVSLPHGWGHDKPGARLSVAARSPGVCNNVLAPGEFVDTLSGNAVVNGIPIRLEAISEISPESVPEMAEEERK